MQWFVLAFILVSAVSCQPELSSEAEVRVIFPSEWHPRGQKFARARDEGAIILIQVDEGKTRVGEAVFPLSQGPFLLNEITLPGEGKSLQIRVEIRVSRETSLVGSKRLVPGEPVVIRLQRISG